MFTKFYLKNLKIFFVRYGALLSNERQLYFLAE